MSAAHGDKLDSVEQKLAAARTRLILEKPFLGALVLRLPLVEAEENWCTTTATNARALYYNPEYIAALSLEQTQFVLAHEALHCALSHFSRRENRKRNRWDIACDYAVNPLIAEEGLEPPVGALMDQSFLGMTAEEIYPSIAENPDEETLDDHLYDSDASEGGEREQNEHPEQTEQDRAGQTPNMQSGQNSSGSRPRPLNEQEKQTLSTQWQKHLASAAQQAMQAGKMRGTLARMIDTLIQPRLPWRHLLARYVFDIARDDYSYVRPSSRRGDGDMLFPSLRSGQANLYVVLDVSGSLSDTELSEFVQEVDGLKSQIRACVTLHACDTQLLPGGPWTYEPWEEFVLPSGLKGGGGTSFIPPFEWIATQDNSPPDLLLYFTDAMGVFPEQAPEYAVLWVVKGRGQVPFGNRIQLN